MIWWFALLAVSSVAVLWVIIAFFLHARRHVKRSAAQAGDEREKTGAEHS
jgi:putative exporter of polyketide antibiotics